MGKNSGTEAVCGMRCGDCKYLGNGCSGCEKERGAPFWTGLVGVPVCPVYGCCSGKRYGHCGCCPDMPCGRFTEIRDPEMTDAQVAENLEQRRLALLARGSDSAK